VSDELIQRLESKSEYWRQTTHDPHGISMAVCVALKEVADAVRGGQPSQLDDAQLIQVAITRKEFRSLPIEAQRRILAQQAEALTAGQKGAGE